MRVCPSPRPTDVFLFLSGACIVEKAAEDGGLLGPPERCSKHRQVQVGGSSQLVSTRGQYPVGGPKVGLTELSVGQLLLLTEPFLKNLLYKPGSMGLEGAFSDGRLLFFNLNFIF